MTILALALLGLGTADAVRAVGAGRWGDAQRGMVTSTLVGTAVIVILALLAGLSTLADLFLLLLACAIVAGWVLTSREEFVRARRAVIPLTILGGGLALLVVTSGAASPAAGTIGRWLAWTDLFAGQSTVDADRVLLIAGLLLLQVATGNVIVRLVLVQVGAIRPSDMPQPSDRMRGGRLLGPMERLIILGLGLAGEVTAATLVIAAKGLIRFPELQHSREADGESKEEALEVYELTEYFLVGSMVSWLIALTAFGVAVLA